MEHNEWSTMELVLKNGEKQKKVELFAYIHMEGRKAGRKEGRKKGTGGEGRRGERNKKEWTGEGEKEVGGVDGVRKGWGKKGRKGGMKKINIEDRKENYLKLKPNPKYF